MVHERLMSMPRAIVMVPAAIERSLLGCSLGRELLVLVLVARWLRAMILETLAQEHDRHHVRQQGRLVRCQHARQPEHERLQVGHASLRTA